MKVHIWPTPQEIEADNGVGRIVHAQYKYLPALGVEIVSPDKATLLVGHTQQHTLPRIDVLHCHGLYWTGDPGSGVYTPWHNTANMKIAEAARRAKVITVPSDWVGMPFKRDMHLSPEVVGHGIYLNEWNPRKENDGYILWNKNRGSDVCDPTPAVRLAERGYPVVSTFAPNSIIELPSTLTIIGKQPQERMREYVHGADIYLATVQETFGIGTLEAMAAGVPVLGYNWGGTADLVKHQETGFLVEPGDIEGLVMGLEWLRNNRKRISENAREFASRYDWNHVIRRYLEVYDKALKKDEGEGKVSIVIPCYNYATYLPQAIESCLAQTIKCEIIVVDDGSTDNTPEVCKDFKDKITYIRQESQGVAAARNAGIQASKGEYLVCLDADDMLDSRYTEVLAKAMKADRGLGVAYTGMLLVLGDDNATSLSKWPPAFDWGGITQPNIPPPSCIPSASMFRRRMWERAGGYHQEYAPGEDTEFWVRGLSLGFTAQQVSEEALFTYRAHAGSASRRLKYRRIDDWKPWMRDKHYPLAAPSKTAPLVSAYSQPLVSVIIPVSKAHLPFLGYALQSLEGQTFRKWEVIVVWDGDFSRQKETVERIKTLYPFAKYVTALSVNGGPGVCRNFGLRQAKAPLSLFLDADDYLQPSALEEMLKAYVDSKGCYVYTDWIAQDVEKSSIQTCPEYDPQAMLHKPQHAVTVLMDTVLVQKVKFDEELGVLEDWDFFAKCAIKGIYGVRVAQPLVSVRVYTGTRTQTLKDNREEILERIQKRYEGVKEMAACNTCGTGGGAVIQAKQAIGSLPPDLPELQPMTSESNFVRMEFIGPQKGEMSYGGRGTTPSGKTYRGANNVFNKYADVDKRDVDWMQRTGVWKVVTILPTEAKLAAPTEVVAPNPPALVLRKRGLTIPAPEVVVEELNAVEKPIAIDEMALPVQSKPKRQKKGQKVNA